MEKINSSDWNEKYDLLKNSMKKEVNTLREILANLHLEKELLILNDPENLGKVLQERTFMLNRPQDIHDQSVKALRQFPCSSIKQLFQTDEIAACEALMLEEQLNTLTEKINLQNQENKILNHQHNNHCMPYYMQKETPAPKKKKTKVVIENQEDE